MSSETHNPSPSGTLVAAVTAGSVTAVVPARNEEAVIAASIASLASQPEIAEILVVNDQSTDRTVSVVRSLMEKIPNLRLLESRGLPGCLGCKNHGLLVGLQKAKSAQL